MEVAFLQHTQKFKTAVRGDCGYHRFYANGKVKNSECHPPGEFYLPGITITIAFRTSDRSLFSYMIYPFNC